MSAASTGKIVIGSLLLLLHVVEVSSFTWSWIVLRRPRRQKQQLAATRPQRRKSHETTTTTDDDDDDNDDELLLFSSKQRTLEDNGSTITNSNNQCPFSKAFTRYRIDLTPVSSEPTETTTPTHNNRLLSLPFFGNLLPKSWARQTIEQEFGTNNNVRWFDDKDHQTGVEVLATLWRCAADLALGGGGGGNAVSLLPDDDDKVDNHDESSSSSSSIVLAFPNAKSRVVRQWIDILEWMMQNCRLHQDDDDGTTRISDESTPILKAEYLNNKDNIPCLRLTRQHGAITTTSSPSSSSSLHHQVVDEDPAVVEKRMQSWVKRILVDLQICPFTKSTKMSGQGLADVGVPVGRIAYHTSLARKTNLLQLMAEIWEAIRDMLAAGPSGKEGGISSILMAAPGFDDDFDLWAGPVFSMLEAGVIAAGAEHEVGVVCFHPEYVTPDGSTFPGFGHMHSLPRLQKWLLEDQQADDPTTCCPTTLSTEQVAAGGAWQRRTPHATINVLRADQLAAAEGRRTTGTLYSENIRKLVNQVGLEKLQADLDRERSIR